MKNSKIVKFVVISIIAFGVWTFLNKDQASNENQITLESENESRNDEDSDHNKLKGLDSPTKAVSDPSSPLVKNDLTPAPQFIAQNKEEESLGMMSTLLRDSLPLERDSQDLIQALEKLQLSPEYSRDSNPYTGEMTIVRTKNNLTGTRYFHAQYFKDENGREFLQHTSFEFKGGPGAFDRVKAAARSKFGLGAPVRETKDFIQWNISEDREIWIKVMSEKELQDDPYNAYTKADVGTIRLAIERKIHDDQSQDHVENE